MKLLAFCATLFVFGFGVFVIDSTITVNRQRAKEFQVRVDLLSKSRTHKLTSDEFAKLVESEKLDVLHNYALHNQ